MGGVWWVGHRVWKGERERGGVENGREGKEGILRGGCWCLFFFFSSRRRHTRFDCDWSSDVCSSDLQCDPAGRSERSAGRPHGSGTMVATGATDRAARRAGAATSHEDARPTGRPGGGRSEEHTSELQSQSNLVCRLLLEKKKKTNDSV